MAMASWSRARATRALLDRCVDCCVWLAQIENLQRRVRVRPADLVPDLSTSILEKAHPPRPGRGEWVRYSLVVVALTQLVIALPDLLSVSADQSVHDSRHFGAMAVALSLGLLYTAQRPTRAYGVLPIVAALAVTMIGAAAIDVMSASPLRLRTCEFK